MMMMMLVMMMMMMDGGGGGDDDGGGGGGGDNDGDDLNSLEWTVPVRFPNAAWQADSDVQAKRNVPCKLHNAEIPTIRVLPRQICPRATHHQPPRGYREENRARSHSSVGRERKL